VGSKTENDRPDLVCLDQVGIGTFFSEEEICCSVVKTQTEKVNGDVGVESENLVRSEPGFTA
jgi:hypothetical protein